jgi:hypothetical protein
VAQLPLDYLRRTPGRTKTSRLIDGWRYIGASKPACRLLCRYYFDICAPEVVSRTTRNNVYYCWRQPGTYRLKVDLLEAQVGGSKVLDSNTYTERIRQL